MTKDEVLLEVWNMNRCKRWLALLLGAVLLLGTMSGCSGTTASDREDGAYRKINLSMAVNGTDTQIDSLVAHHFADLVAERSGGSITIDAVSYTHLTLPTT